jgi:hypothetical protein
MFKDSSVSTADVEQARSAFANGLIQQVLGLPSLCRQICRPVVSVIEILAVREVGHAA